MPITTYARLQDILQTADTDIVEAQNALKGLEGIVVVKEVPLRRSVMPKWWQFPLFNRYRLEAGYQVLHFIADTSLGPEWQVINFYREGTGTSINTTVPKELVLAYLYGCTARRAD
jgi:hypothetical protein